MNNGRKRQTQPTEQSIVCPDYQNTDTKRIAEYAHTHAHALKKIKNNLLDTIANRNPVCYNSISDKKSVKAEWELDRKELGIVSLGISRK